MVSRGPRNQWAPRWWRRHDCGHVCCTIRADPWHSHRTGRNHRLVRPEDCRDCKQIREHQNQ